MNYEDIWQKQDEITASVNSLGFSLWDLHYDRPSFSFLLELNEHVPDDAPHKCHCQQIMTEKAATVQCSRCTHKKRRQ